jgi:hypothetical protein
MEPWQIVFISLYGGILAYLALSQVQQGKMISSMSSTLDHISRMQEKMEKKQDEIEDKIDKMMNQHINTLNRLLEKLANK